MLKKLTQDIVLNSRAQLVSLARPSDRPKIGAVGTVTGYGTNPDHRGNKHLFRVDLEVISAEQCTNELAGGTAEEVDKHQICAQYPGRNQCEGDSGGNYIMDFCELISL